MKFNLMVIIIKSKQERECQMFWGTVIKEGQPLKSQKVLETSEFAVLHLSAAIADKPSAKATRLYVKNAKEAEVIIANLTDKSESVVLDLYINCT
jgi:hypothetical protein